VQIIQRHSVNSLAALSANNAKESIMVAIYGHVQTAAICQLLKE